MIASIILMSLGGALAFADTPPAETATRETSESEPSNQRLICRSRPVVGSRIARQRTCKTAEEWRIYQNDLEASRRDINDRGMRGCDLSVTDC